MSDKKEKKEQENSEESKTAFTGPQGSNREEPELPGEPKNETEKRIDELEEQLTTANDKYLRLYSEFDNFRKRTAKERSELVKTAGEEIIKSMLPVIDDMERALRTNEKTQDVAAVQEGVKLIVQKFHSILGRNGLEPIVSIGEPFNVDLHEAVTNAPAPDKNMKGKVIDEVEKGYLLNGKVIRFAKVIVGN